MGLNFRRDAGPIVTWGTGSIRVSPKIRAIFDTHNHHLPFL